MRSGRDVSKKAETEIVCPIAGPDANPSSLGNFCHPEPCLASLCSAGGRRCAMPHVLEPCLQPGEGCLGKAMGRMRQPAPLQAPRARRVLLLKPVLQGQSPLGQAVGF